MWARSTVLHKCLTQGVRLATVKLVEAEVGEKQIMLVAVHVLTGMQ